MSLSLQLSGFADETSESKAIGEQLAAMAAIGLRRYSLRFLDLGHAGGEPGIKNAMQLTKKEITLVKRLHAEFDMEVASLGSPIGKVKLLDIDDGTGNKYIPFKKYLKKDVATACRLANAFETKLVRGFSFYHPKGKKPEDYLTQVVDQLGEIAEACAKEGLLFGLEVEANLVGQSGKILKKIHNQVKHPALVLIFDAANLLCQGYSVDETYEEYLAMKPGLGWLHIKDYRPLKTATRGGHIDEASLSDFKPVSHGSGIHERVLQDLRDSAPTINRRMKKLGLPGLLLDLEPHVRGGGQFGGYSGADGMGIAARALCGLLDYLGLEADLRGPKDLA